MICSIDIMRIYKDLPALGVLPVVENVPNADNGKNCHNPNTILVVKIHLKKDHDKKTHIMIKETFHNLNPDESNISV